MVKDCALVSISTGEKAYTLAELAERLKKADPACIYHHFWSRHLRPSFDHPEFHNDFAAWVHQEIRDRVLAERLNLIAPNEYRDIEVLRETLLVYIQERIFEDEYLGWRKADNPFYFVKSQLVIFDTGLRIEWPYQIADALESFSPGSIFFHFIDARRRHPQGLDDFRDWISKFPSEYKPLEDLIARVDPFFLSLYEIRDFLVRHIRAFCAKMQAKREFYERKIRGSS
ncbi:DUF5752 family protein [Thermosulfurimonas dismutans]|uniref:Uncharacterized protein n=1 Tax=Thermosulfurimonas dismutans TaxID=999894 RepID=A0A179D6Z1_9BACT|nr:DUF5752 family protein [Thermosulfurimonas dismutans]OAQ21509.1 hypothetical protein TDIS_0027 [Thermosulfurimonas dismutans]